MSAYLFRPATYVDVSLLRCWRARPHVMEWWGDPVVEAPDEVLSDSRVSKWIVEHRGRPFAYAQDYSPRDWTQHPFSYLPEKSRGIDQFIGEPDMLDRGHGTAFVQEHCARLFGTGVPKIGTDPHPDNKRAIRAYEKAGFAIVSGPQDTNWGRAILMECSPH